MITLLGDSSSYETGHLNEAVRFKLRNSFVFQLASSIRVSQAVLLTLTGYVEWVTSQHIFASNNVLLSTLYALLDIPELKLNAVEVLQQIVNRKARRFSVLYYYC